ncbi:DUF7825 domain-containing protein [Nonomuraea sp. SYSU D8015]|uniref:DUF7825 domain-containing protein n=1 Tax=Nonomuraea sp. SYSU D8015 TaxID=2593644 RepID=UPI001660E7A8|nr:DUF6493 family protein [Nonomuraea sp. SYSU D8015]
MSAWDDLLTHVRAGDVAGTTRLVAELDAAGRRTIAAELPRYLAAHGPDRVGWWEWDRRLSPLLVAGAGCLSGAAAVTAWLLRREFRRRGGYGDVPHLLRLLRLRPAAWQADLALRLAARLRHTDRWPWAVTAALVRENGVEPPGGDPFMTGWLRQLVPGTAAGDPLLAAYGPRLFEIDALALMDVRRVVESVVRLVADGLLERAGVIDGLIGRLLRDGPAAPAPLAVLHDRLDLDLDEAAGHARDYARLLPAGPVAVADMALAQLRRLEEAGRLEEELFAEALEALAFRPEKKLLRAVLSWAADAVLRAPHPIPALVPARPDELPEPTAALAGRDEDPEATTAPTGREGAPGQAGIPALDPTSPGPVAGAGPAGRDGEPGRVAGSGSARGGGDPGLAAGSDPAGHGGALAPTAGGGTEGHGTGSGRADIPALDPTSPGQIAGIGPTSRDREPGRAAGSGDPGRQPAAIPALDPTGPGQIAGGGAAGRGGGPGRVDTVLRAMAMIFRQDTLALQERAAALAVTLAPQAGADGREAVRDSAAVLPDELREKIAAAYGGAIDEEAATVTPLAEAGDGRRMPPHFASPGELAHALATFVWPPDVYDFERLLADLADWSHRDPEALRAALHPWWHPFDPRAFGRYGHMTFDTVVEALRRAFLAFASPQDSRALSRTSPHHHDAWTATAGTIDRLYLRRAQEFTARFEDGGAYPVVLATPTAGTGHLEPGVLLDRLERLEAAGVAALPADLTQALLRLPREIPAADAARAGRLTSDAGRACAAWMAAGRPADPRVTVRLGKEYRHGCSWPVLQATVTLPDAPDAPDAIGAIGELLEPRWGHLSTPSWWPAAMPSHRDVVAAHLADRLFSTMETGGGEARVLASLAHGDGPTGPGMAYALACGMGHPHAADRAAAAEALLTLATRGEVPVAELGEAVVCLAEAGFLKLNRMVAVLDDATQAGAHEAVWALIVRVLPGLLPKAGERPRAGLADLLAAGARAARIAGARADLPEVAEIAARKGSSRLVQEARRLRQLVAR